jgi:hypothetical protein
MSDTDPIRGPDGSSEIALGAVEFIARVRDTYVDQFRAFAEHQVAEGVEGASEIKLELERSDGVLKQLYCADFMMATDDGYEPILFQAENQLFFEPFEARIGAIDIAFASFGWDGIEIRYESALTAEQILDDWHDYWFDPDDERRDPDTVLSGNIHNVVVFSGGVSVDMGTAPAEAFWDLLEAFDAAGITRLEIGGDGDVQ